MSRHSMEPLGCRKVMAAVSDVRTCDVDEPNDFLAEESDSAIFFPILRTEEERGPNINAYVRESSSASFACSLFSTS
jgi:hypothetical protein